MRINLPVWAQRKSTELGEGVHRTNHVMAIRRTLFRSAPAVAASLTLPRSAKALEQRDEVAFLRGPYNEALYDRHDQILLLHMATGRLVGQGMPV